MASLLDAIAALLRRRRRSPRVIELGVGRTRSLRAEEEPRAAEVVRAVRQALRAAPPGRRLANVDDLPLAEVRASVTKPGCYRVRFRRQVTFVPLGEARPRAISIDWGPRGLSGSTTTEVVSAEDDPPPPAVGPAQPQQPLLRSEPEALAFIDRAMREQGDFGVYGDVREGLNDLHPNLTVEIRERPDTYQVSISPEDGYGHFLSFSVDKASGELGAPMAGHLDRGGPDEGDAER